MFCTSLLLTKTVCCYVLSTKLCLLTFDEAIIRLPPWSNITRSDFFIGWTTCLALVTMFLPSVIRMRLINYFIIRQNRCHYFSQKYPKLFLIYLGIDHHRNQIVCSIKCHRMHQSGRLIPDILGGGQQGMTLMHQHVNVMLFWVSRETECGWLVKIDIFWVWREKSVSQPQTGRCALFWAKINVYVIQMEW